MIVLEGIKNLFKSTKGTLSLIILACAMTAVMCGKLESNAFAAVISTIGSIFMFTRMKSDQQGVK